MDVYKKETDYIVSSELIDVCYNVLEVLRDAISELTNASKEFFINVLLFSAEYDNIRSQSRHSCGSSELFYIGPT
ncbi:hypothetical protein V6Z11_D05G145200 [Gossypium hirsutum]